MPDAPRASPPRPRGARARRVRGGPARPARGDRGGQGRHAGSHPARDDRDVRRARRRRSARDRDPQAARGLAVLERSRRATGADSPLRQELAARNPPHYGLRECRPRHPRCADGALRPPRDRRRPGGPEGRDPGLQARPARRRRRGRAGRRVQRLQRHDPVEDPARGGALPDRLQPARDLRPELPRQGRHHDGRPAHAGGGRQPARGRRHPRPARAQPRDGLRRLRELRRQRHRRDHARRTAAARSWTPTAS